MCHVSWEVVGVELFKLKSIFYNSTRNRSCQIAYIKEVKSQEFLAWRVPFLIKEATF